MRFLMPFMFVIFAVIGGGVVVFVNSPGTPVLSVSSSSSPSTSEENKPNGLTMVLAMLTGDDVAAQAPVVEISGALAPFLPEPGIGWTREAYETAHGEALTGATYQKSAVIISTTNSLLSHFDGARRDANGTAATYRKGDEVVAVSITTRTNRDMRSLQGSMMTVIAGNLAASTAFGDRPSGFGNLHGVNFSFGPTTSTMMATRVEVPINYRTLSASMGGQVGIKVMTNASDASIAEVIAGLDIPGLNTTLVTPDLAVTAGTGLITSQREALSTLPPEPSLQYKAFHRLRGDVSDLSQDDVRLLQTIAGGQITSWIDIYETYGLHYRLSDAMTEILGDKPVLAPIDQVRFEAMTMLQNPAVLAPYEIDILRELAKGRFATREKAQRQLSQSRLYGPPLLRLINKLPLEPAEDVAATGADEETVVATTEEPREIVVRRGTAIQQGDVQGTDCTIELGVRRCTMGDETE